MHVSTDTTKIERAFFRSAEFKAMVRVGGAAFRPRMSGGFAAILDARQGYWAALNERYRTNKAAKGLDARRWVRTGRTLAALSKGPIMREGTRSGVRYKVTPGRWIAHIRVGLFGPRRGKRPGPEVQKKVFRNLNYGIDAAGKVTGGLRDKRGRKLSGRHARPLFTWSATERADIEKSVAIEAQAILDEAMRRPT